MLIEVAVSTVLWILQVLLAIAFLVSGAMKVITPREKMLANENMAWAEDFSDSTVKMIGALEVLAGIGLILPALLGIAPILPALAALGLVIVMLGAVVVHARRNEPRMIGVNVVLLVIAAVVAWGRFGPYAL